MLVKLLRPYRESNLKSSALGIGRIPLAFPHFLYNLDKDSIQEVMQEIEINRQFDGYKNKID